MSEVPPELRRLPVVDWALNKHSQHADELRYIAQAEPGSGKTMILPALEALRNEGDGVIALRQPSRLVCQSIEAALQRFWGPLGLEVGIKMAGTEKNLGRADLVLVSDGSLASLRRSRGIDSYFFDEFHTLSLPASEIELASEKRRGTPMRALTATIDAAPVAEWMEGPAWTIPGRAHKLNHRYAPLTDPGDNLSLIADAMQWRPDDGKAITFLPTRDLCEKAARRDKGESLACHGGVDPAAVFDWVDDNDGEDWTLYSTSVAATGITVPANYSIIADRGISGHSIAGINAIEKGPMEDNTVLQCAGRTGRTEEGTAILLYDATSRIVDHTGNPWPLIVPHPVKPPSERGQVFDALLYAGKQGIPFKDLDILGKPDAASLESAAKFLRRAGLVNVEDKLTGVGELCMVSPTDPLAASIIQSMPTQASKSAACGMVAVNGVSLYNCLATRRGSNRYDQATWHRRSIVGDDVYVRGSTPASMALIAYGARRNSARIYTWCEANDLLSNPAKKVAKAYETLVEFFKCDTEPGDWDEFHAALARHPSFRIANKPGEIDRALAFPQVRKGAYATVMGIPLMIGKKDGGSFMSHECCFKWSHRK